MRAEANRARLTDKSINAKDIKGEVIWDTLVTGLHLRAGDRGRVFYLTTRIKSHDTAVKDIQIKIKLGKAGVISVPEARAKARNFLALADDGIDPRAERQRAAHEARRKESTTFAKMVRQFMAAPERRDISPNTRAQYDMTFEASLLPRFGDMPVSEIERDDVREFFQEYGTTAPTAANRALFLLRAVLNFAVDEGAIQFNVSDRIKRYKERPRDRWLDDREIALLWRACDRVAYPAGRIAQLLLLTGARRLEVGHLPWSEIDGDIWRLPGSRTKNGTPNEIPLTPQALAILKSCWKFDGVDAVFTSGRKGDEPVAAWSGFKRTLDRVIRAIQTEDAVAADINPVEPLERQR